MTTWTPKGDNSSAWSPKNPASRVFDPFVFDRAPVFDTGDPSGIWDAKSTLTNGWTAE